MGVTALWDVLHSIGAVKECSGVAGIPEILKHVDGHAIAIDTTIWMVEAMTQPNLKEVFHSDKARVLKVCFDRSVQWLRFGCIPVAVLEGDCPPEKIKEIQRRLDGRHKDGGWRPIANAAGERGMALQSLNDAVRRLFDSLGLPVVQAPGEAEATCAALQRAGLVHACATTDSDAFAFGATRIFKALHLVVGSPKLNEMKYCDVRSFCKWLDITNGGSQAFIVLSLMVGGDYSDGVDRIGPTSALQFIKFLLKDEQDDFNLIELLHASLMPSSGQNLKALPTQCSGCKQCKHEGNRKGKIQRHTAQNHCQCCAPDIKETNKAFCILREGPCQCRFHTSAAERMFFKVLTKLRASSFSEDAIQAKNGYEKQHQAAEHVAQQLCAESSGSLQWQARPDPEQVLHAVSGGLEWSLQTVEKKLKSLLREWDLTHPSKAAVYKPKRIVKVAGSAESDSADLRWAYLIDFLKNGKDDREDNGEHERSHAGMPWHKHDSLSQKQKASQNSAHSRKSGQAEMSNTRFVRQSAMRRFWPELVNLFEESQKQKVAAQAKALQRRKEKDRQSGMQNSRAQSSKQTTLDSFMRATKLGAQKLKDPFAANRDFTGTKASRSDIDVNLISPESANDEEPACLSVDRSKAIATGWHTELPVCGPSNNKQVEESFCVLHCKKSASHSSARETDDFRYRDSEDSDDGCALAVQDPGRGVDLIGQDCQSLEKRTELKVDGQQGPFARDSPSSRYDLEPCFVSPSKKQKTPQKSPQVRDSHLPSSTPYGLSAMSSGLEILLSPDTDITQEQALTKDGEILNGVRKALCFDSAGGEGEHAGSLQARQQLTTSQNEVIDLTH